MRMNVYFSLRRLSELLFLAILSSPALASHEIAVLTVRRDNIHKTMTSELIPIAKIDQGKISSIKKVEVNEKEVCSPTEFSGSRKPGVVYDVLRRGEVIGTTTSVKKSEGSYSCSALCVVRATTSLKIKSPGIKSERRGFDKSGIFDESITQYVAISSQSIASNETTPPFSSKVSTPVSNEDRTALSAFAEKRVLSGVKRAGRKFRLESAEAFVATEAGEINFYLVGVLDHLAPKPDSEIRVITTVVRKNAVGEIESLFELLESGDLDKGAATYELVDAIDFDSDGVVELLVIYHNYEFHEYQILKLRGTKFEIVHKGPSFGC